MAFTPPLAEGGRSMKKKIAKKLQLNRETLSSLEKVQGGKNAAFAAGTHYRSLCADLCQETDEPTVLTD
jgi:hypothetical protein